ncbi:HEAT repeat domain-containing protein [Cytobacillus sp. FJAT-54145]|uniref:HEAT repeat domain-containing protein n=1 Tax=Cytobacillus spartinae TaxID=3299023 RepID=A0ABW6K993_9BACI
MKSDFKVSVTKKNLPDNFDELKKSLNRASNWRERLDTIDKLGAWKSKEAIELLKYRLKGDSVYRVQEAAYDQLVSWGQDVTMPEKKTGELFKDTNKILLRIKKSLPEDHSFEDFKEKVKKMRMDLYDTYEGNKGKNFNKWLKETWASLDIK